MPQKNFSQTNWPNGESIQNLYCLIDLTLRRSPPSGDRKNDCLPKVIGTCMPGTGENSKLFSKVTNPIRACIMPNREPIPATKNQCESLIELKNWRFWKKPVQFLGPKWNGNKKTSVSGMRFETKFQLKRIFLITISKWQPRHWIAFLDLFTFEAVWIKFVWIRVVFWIMVDSIDGNHNVYSFLYYQIWIRHLVIGLCISCEIANRRILKMQI